jgi:tetratricopeptide (TPR) repeat protein
MLKFFKFFLYILIISILFFKFTTFYYISQGDRYYREKNYQKAIFYYEKLRRIKEKNVYYNLANLYYKINELEKAIENLEKFLKYNNSDADAYHLLAIFYYEKDDLNNAEKNCEISVKMNNKYLSDLNLIREEKKAEKFLTKIESENFIIKFNPEYEENSARALIEILEKIHKKTFSLKYFSKKEKTVVKIYDEFTFEKVTGTSSSSSCAAFINNKIFLHSPRFFLISKNIEEILTHEYIHLIIQRIVKGNIPTYLNEGIAEFFSKGYLSPSEKMKLREILEENKIISFEKLKNNWENLNREEREIAYLQAKAFIEYIVKNFGWEILGKILKEFSKERKEDEIFKDLTGKELKNLEKEFLSNL